MGKTGNAFNVVVAGSDIDLEKLVAGGLEEFKKVFHDMVKFEGAEVVELSWISLFRSETSFYLHGGPVAHLCLSWVDVVQASAAQRPLGKAEFSLAEITLTSTRRWADKDSIPLFRTR